MIRRRPKNLHTRGAAAVAMVILLVMLSLITVGMVMAGGRDQDLTVRRLETVRAFYAAEGGMNMGLREVVMRSDIDSDGGIGSISDDGNDGNNPTFSSGSVWAEANGAGLQTTVISHGSSGVAARRLESTVEDQHTGPGLIASYYTASSAPSTLADIGWTGAASQTSIISMLNMASSSGAGWPGGPTNNWGKKFTGSITIPTTGTWTFYTNSDDGSKLWINGAQVVNNDGLHGMTTQSGAVALAAGAHDIEVQWFEASGAFGLIVYWSGPGVPAQTIIPASAYSH